MNRGGGFTLIELLVAVAIFAVVSVIAYGGLATVMDTRERVDTETARLASVQTAFTVMARDFRSATPLRGYRDRRGDPQVPLHADGDTLMLVHGGRPNPLGRRRSHFERIAYAVRDGALVRERYAMVDSPYEPQVTRTVLLDGVTEVGFRFLFDDWQPTWPPPANADTDVPVLPRAVAVSLRHPQYGILRRVFLLP
ncbi:type II secretion system minor pseudopilin GspJ [Arhodomonas aquaeolei]|uniref:type II secretion system minor pseudopilin GspJ n=1 Tax=Arhodomonas aquaeolei TaxID=2369 RepID=UPI0003704C45|nr:type II secretion system minor pseudopilin GspJ [Arhodomonas aquaeolei]